MSQALYRVRIGFTDDAGLNAIPEGRDGGLRDEPPQQHGLHRRFSYLAAERAALSYAVGEWARVMGLQHLIRAMGAYFVRRNSKDELYRRVLERYIAMATEAGVTQAVYPEGGLTKDGLMREPRFGVLDYMLRGYHHGGERDLVFVPLGLNYDRVLEDRTQLRSRRRHAACGRPGGAAHAGFCGSRPGLMLRSRWYRLAMPASTSARRCRCANGGGARGIDFDAPAQGTAPGRGGGARPAPDGSRWALIPVLPVPLVAMRAGGATCSARCSDLRAQGRGGRAGAATAGARRAAVRAAWRLGLRHRAPACACWCSGTWWTKRAGSRRVPLKHHITHHQQRRAGQLLLLHRGHQVGQRAHRLALRGRVRGADHGHRRVAGRPPAQAVDDGPARAPRPCRSPASARSAPAPASRGRGHRPARGR
jgi:hypothetical protein